MNIEIKNRLIIISSPSGAGKTTICKLLIKKMKNLILSVSYTSEKGIMKLIKKIMYLLMKINLIS